jgi:hypothetical protein
MVSLAVCPQASGKVPTSLGANDNSYNLRDSAIWYPQPPPTTLNLNEHLLVAPDMYTSGYRPLFWTWFGGPGGSLLSKLVKIKIFGYIGRIDFIFSCPGMTTECQSFGRIDIDDSEETENEQDKAVEFMIDGPGGETINRVEIYQAILPTTSDWLSREGILTRLKVRFLPARRQQTVWEVPRAEIGNRYIQTADGRARSAGNTNPRITGPSCEKSFWPRQEPQLLASMAFKYVTTPSRLAYFAMGNKGLPLV